MENEFVTYEQAVKLKELGFDPFLREDCLAYFNTSNSNNELETKDWWCLPKNDFQYALSAPLKQQVFRWVTKEYKIHSSYGTTSNDNENINGYTISRYVNGIRIRLSTNYEVGTYEEAENECINKLISLIEAKN